MTVLAEGSILVTDCKVSMLIDCPMARKTHGTRLEIDTKVVLELFWLSPLELLGVVDETLGHLGPDTSVAIANF